MSNIILMAESHVIHKIPFLDLNQAFKIPLIIIPVQTLKEFVDTLN